MGKSRASKEMMMSEKEMKPMMGQKKMAKVMGEFKRGKLHSGSGSVVRKRSQAIAIGMHESGLSKKK